MQNQNMFDREVRFEIKERIGVIVEHSTGWTKELNLVSWNGGPPKYDIRDWDPDHGHMSRGVTLTENEMRTIIRLLRSRGRKSGVNEEDEKQKEPQAADNPEEPAGERF